MKQLNLPQFFTQELRSQLVALGCRWNGVKKGTDGFGWLAPEDAFSRAQAICDQATARQQGLVAKSIAGEMLNEGFRDSTD